VVDRAFGIGGVMVSKLVLSVVDRAFGIGGVMVSKLVLSVVDRAFGISGVMVSKFIECGRSCVRARIESNQRL
jgi:hypothetical protein